MQIFRIQNKLACGLIMHGFNDDLLNRMHHAIYLVYIPRIFVRPYDFSLIHELKKPYYCK